MKWPPLLPGVFIRRDNRFRATVQVGDEEAKAHVPNSGRLWDLFIPGRPLWLIPRSQEGRKTAYDLVLVKLASTLVSVDARLPNRLFLEALTCGLLEGFPRAEIETEVSLGDSRFDFRLRDSRKICWVETKSVTLVEKGLALFPDAPTSRGRKHIQALVHALSAGAEAAVVFVVQRPDAERFAPNPEADPQFAQWLQEAATLGVMVRAFRCRVNLEEITIWDEIPVLFKP